MPADIVARLEAALAAEATAPVIPIDAARSHRRRTGGSAGQRRGRQVAGWAAAAALLVAVGTGVVVAWPNSPMHGATDASQPNAAAGQATNPPGPMTALNGSGTGGKESGYAVRASGTDYNQASLDAAAQVGRAANAPASQPPGATPGPSVPAPAPGVPPGASNDLQAPGMASSLGLGRLADPAALRTCLGQITASHPGVVVSVDYARYNGTPAVIVVVLQTHGAVAVAVGADCGLTGSAEIATATA
jgi:hypothetical protein